MLGSYLITFREVLEAALVCAIMLVYLGRTEAKTLRSYVWYGVYAAAAVSVGLAILIRFVYGDISETSQTLFEGIAALVAVIVLSIMIYWMATGGQRLKQDIEKKVQAITIGQGAALGIALFAFVAVVREGIETVLFLTPFLLVNTAPTLLGFAAGLVSSIILSYAIFKVGASINLRQFFYFTSILLILLAGGLVGDAIHEFLEYAELVKVETGWLGATAYALNIPPGTVLSDTGVIGSILSVMFGFAVKMEWARVMGHALYLAVVLPLTLRVYRRKPTAPDSAIQTGANAKG